MSRELKRLLRFADPKVSHDGSCLAVRVETVDGSNLDLEIPLNEIGTLVQFFVSIADHVGNEAAPSPIEAPTEGVTWSPIPVRGLGFGAGRDASETILMVQLAGFQLAFSLDSSKLASLADDVARIARTLSAKPSGKPS